MGTLLRRIPSKPKPRTRYPGAIAGCDIEFGNDTSWAVHNVKDWETHEKLEFDPENEWWKKIREITEAAIAEGIWVVY